MSAEDLEIWDRVLARILPGERVVVSWAWFVLSKRADYEDFALLRLAQRVASCGPSGFELRGIPCRGWSVGVLSPQRFKQMLQ